MNRDNSCGWTSSIAISECRKNSAPLLLRRKVRLNRWKRERDYSHRSPNTKRLLRKWNLLRYRPPLLDHPTSQLKPELIKVEPAWHEDADFLPRGNKD